MERDETIETSTEAPALEPPPESSASDYRIHVEAFEGPLDLLLYLIRKEEVSIYDIPIARITEQYLEYLRMMDELDIGVAGEFLVMAATLIHIKTRMLLPRDPVLEGEEESIEDPRQELVERLLEHQRVRSAAEHLHHRYLMERAVFTRPVSEEDRANMEVSAGVFDLLTAFRDVLLRAQALMEIEIARDEVTLAQKLTEIRGLLHTNDQISVYELFERARSRRELVIIFLAILELVKELEVTLQQPEPFGDILARRCEQAGAEAAVDLDGEPEEEPEGAETQSNDA